MSTNSTNRKPAQVVDPDGGTKSSSYLLRMPPALRTQLEDLKTSSKARSLQALIIQLLAQGVSQEEGASPADFVVTRDIPRQTLSSAISEGEIRRDVHTRIVNGLEAQRLTATATLMDVALDSFRRLSEFATFTPDQRQKIDLAGEFAAGLHNCAGRAMDRGQWSIAEDLLRCAATVGSASTQVRREAGIFELRRFVRRWTRSGHASPGVTNGTYWLVSSAPTDARPEERADERTDRSLINEVIGLLRSGSDENSVDAETEVWAGIAELIRLAMVFEMDGADGVTDNEAAALVELPARFWSWSRSFATIDRVVDLHRACERYVEALEVLWWLGYRRQAHSIAVDTRGWEGMPDVKVRLQLLKHWDVDLVEVLDDAGFVHESWDLFGPDRMEEDDDGNFIIVSPREMPRCPNGREMVR